MFTPHINTITTIIVLKLRYFFKVTNPSLWVAHSFNTSTQKIKARDNMAYRTRQGLKKRKRPEMVVYTLDPSTWEAEAGEIFALEASLIYRASPPVSQGYTEKQINKFKLQARVNENTRSENFVFF